MTFSLAPSLSLQYSSIHFFMGKHTQAYHQISFFNPAYCLQPLTNTKEFPQKCSRNHSFTFSNSGRHHLHTSYHHDFDNNINNNNPCSPKIGCMGQIKRNNKLSWPWMSTPSTTRTSSSSSSSNNGSSRKFLKLGRVFSSRSLIISPPRVSSSTSEIKVDDVYRVNSTIISVTDMDPPLPVVKNIVPKETNPASSSSTLWKRRRGGDQINGLEDLQISSSMSVCATVSCAS